MDQQSSPVRSAYKATPCTITDTDHSLPPLPPHHSLQHHIGNIHMQFGQYPYAIAATAPRAGRAHFRLLGLTTLAYKMDNLRWFALQGSSWWAATEAVHATAKQPKFFLLTSRRRPPRCGSADKAPHMSPIPSLPLSTLAATQPRCGSAGKAPRISAVT